MTFIWKSHALYLNNIYLGKIVSLYPFDKDYAAFLQTIPTGAMIGYFPTEDAAKDALVEAAKIALDFA